MFPPCNMNVTTEGRTAAFSRDRGVTNEIYHHLRGPSFLAGARHLVAYKDLGECFWPISKALACPPQYSQAR